MAKEVGHVLVQVTDDLRAAYFAWRRTRFPAGSNDDELDDIHADLALFDAEVADTVVPLMERGMEEAPEFPDWYLPKLIQVQSRLRGLVAAGGVRGGAAATYLSYANLLRRILELILP